MVLFFLAFYNPTLSFCVAKENPNNVVQNTKPKTSATEKNADKNKAKIESQKKEEKSPKDKNDATESANKPDNENKNDEPQKEKTEEGKTVKSKSTVPKMNSILPEKSTTNEQPTENNNENKEKEFSEVEFNLPEVSDTELDTAVSAPITEETPQTRDVPKTILAWLLIASGVVLILVAIIINLKMPHDMNFRYHGKHNARTNRRKNNYRLRYK